MKRLICFLTALAAVASLGVRVCALTVGVSAKAAVLIDAQTGVVIYAKNRDMRLPMASTTKIMTTLLTLESGGLDTEFVIDSEALLTEGSSMYLREGDAVTKRELCYGMMLPSGNDAANAAALKLAGDYESFARKMNRRAAEIGMKNTNFVTPSGLHDEKHYSTAYDMALLAREAMENDTFREICRTKNLKLSSENWESDKYLANSNRLLSKYEHCIGIKTGFTDEAGRCLVSAAEKDGVTLIAVTLNAPDDWNDHIGMFEYGFRAAKREKIADAAEEFSVSVAGGTVDSVRCVLAEAPMCTAVNGTMPDITEKYFVNPFVYAPFPEGMVVGKAEYFIDGRQICSVDIKTAEACSYQEAEVKKSLYRRIIDFLKAFFEK